MNDETEDVPGQPNTGKITGRGENNGCVNFGGEVGTKALPGENCF